jgi:iron complex transport system substrate-binding protein
MRGPQRIVCLTEESTEWLYRLGQQDRIVGISGYTTRPRQARLDKPKVSAFLSAKIDKILALQPDLAIGFSDLQADIAAQLIRAGINVLVFNQRSVDEIFAMLFQVAALVDCADEGQRQIDAMRADLAAMAERSQEWRSAGKRLPRVYFEEWDEPHMCGIRWVSELIALAGGVDVCAQQALAPMGKDRIVADGQTLIDAAPDIIFGSWCGKKFRPERVAARPGWDTVPAVRDGALFEIKSVDILQPGPAALTDGVAQLHARIGDWVSAHG